MSHDNDEREPVTLTERKFGPSELSALVHGAPFLDEYAREQVASWKPPS